MHLFIQLKEVVGVESQNLSGHSSHERVFHLPFEDNAVIPKKVSVVQLINLEEFRLDQLQKEIFFCWVRAEPLHILVLTRLVRYPEVHFPEDLDLSRFYKVYRLRQILLPEQERIRWVPSY